VNISEIIRRIGHSCGTLRIYLRSQVPLALTGKIKKPASWTAIESISSVGFRNFHYLPGAFIVRLPI
jgi:hypothetical protein